MTIRRAQWPYFNLSLLEGRGISDEGMKRVEKWKEVLLVGAAEKITKGLLKKPGTPELHTCEHLRKHEAAQIQVR